MNNISYYNSDRLIFWKTLKIKITNLKKEKKEKTRVCNFLWAARSRLIDVGGDSVTK